MKCLGLDYSGAVCAWACVEDGRLISYGSFGFDDLNCIPTKKDGAVLNKIYRQTLDILIKLQPDAVLLEDIFSQSVLGYKKLAKVQGAVQVAMARYEIDIPLIMKLASAIRSPYHLSLYKPEFMEHIDMNKLLSRKFRERVSELKQPKKIKLSWYRKAYKFVKKYIKAYADTEFDIAKKMRIIDFVNGLYGLQLTYAENDTADAILNSFYLYQVRAGIIREAVKLKKKRKIKKAVDKLI